LNTGCNVIRLEEWKLQQLQEVDIAERIYHKSNYHTVSFA